MSHLYYWGAAIFIAALIGFYGCCTLSARTGTGSWKSPVRLIRELLSPTPNIHAMCYTVAAPSTVSYTCPSCGAVTTHPNSPEISVVGAAERLKDLITQLEENGKNPEWSVKFDESQFCDKCTPGRKGPPKLTLIVTHKDEEESHRFEGVTFDDLHLIQDYLNGKNRSIDPSTGREVPIEERYDRLNKLLGLTIESDTKSEKPQNE